MYNNNQISIDMTSKKGNLSMKKNTVTFENEELTALWRSVMEQEAHHE